MERYAEAMNTLFEVQGRCKDLVSGLYQNDNKAEDDEDDDLESVTSLSSVMNNKKNDQFCRVERKRHYVDFEVQELLPAMKEDCKVIGDTSTKTTIMSFLAEYEKLVEHESVLSLDRDVTLRELYKEVNQVGENASRNIVFPEWDNIVDAVGDPQFHKQLDTAEQKFKDYCTVESEMVGISNKITELKKGVATGNEKRLNIMSDLNSKQNAFNNRRPIDICQEQTYRLKKEKWAQYTKAEKAVYLKKALMDIEIAEDSYEGLLEANEEMEVEYKNCLTAAADKRKSLLCHQGILYAKEAIKQDTEAKAQFKRQLEDYTSKYHTQLTNMNQLQIRIKEDREKIMLQLKKMYTMLTGGPLQGMAALVETVQVTGFNEFGKLTANFVKTADLSSADNNAVVSRLRESVVEIFRMNNTLTELETRIKNDTFTFLQPYHDKDAQIKAASKLPKSMDDNVYIDQLQVHLMANNKLLKAYSDDTAKFAQQRFNLAMALTRCEKAMTFGPRQAEAVRFSLLHEPMFEDVVGSPSGSTLMPIMSITSYHNHKRPSKKYSKGFKTNKALPESGANMSANKFVEQVSTLETVANTPRLGTRTLVAVGERETCNKSDSASISSTEDDSSLTSRDENTNSKMSEIESVNQDALPYLDKEMAKIFGLATLPAISKGSSSTAKSAKSTKSSKYARSSRSARPRRSVPPSHAPTAPRASPTHTRHAHLLTRQAHMPTRHAHTPIRHAYSPTRHAHMPTCRAHTQDWQQQDAPPRTLATPRPSTSCSVTFHMQPEREEGGPLDAPTKFLGYTRGVGVFRGVAGGLVDARGVAITQDRKTPTPGSDLLAMERDIRARHVFDIDEEELRLGMGEHYARRLASLSDREAQ